MVLCNDILVLIESRNLYRMVRSFISSACCLLSLGWTDQDSRYRCTRYKREKGAKRRFSSRSNFSVEAIPSDSSTFSLLPLVLLLSFHTWA